MSIHPTEGNCRDYRKKQIDLCGIRAHNLQMAIIPLSRVYKREILEVYALEEKSPKVL